ncbi:MAG: glycosyltransferase family 39 protein [Anaerolineae bacterium]|nr:glycosyltransferase family 39 protein [Candidatus Roseilinea sp.]MDW8451573.1 glycosyltransferase family 39 protein [Anaerolineae bacterium]
MIASFRLDRATGRSHRAWAAAIGLALIVLLGFAARVYHLDFAELAGDEGFSYVFIQRSYGQMISDTLTMREPHPVGSYFLQKAWVSLAGISEFALRFSSVWFGVLAIALAWRFARELGFSRGTALAAAALMALGPFAVFYSREMRMYSMLLALTLASTLLMWMLLHRNSWGIVPAYVAASWLALQMHYYAGFVFVAQNLFVFSSAVFLPSACLRASAPLRFTAAVDRHIVSAPLARWVAAQVMLLALSLPWLIVARDVLVNYHGAAGINLSPAEALTAWFSAFLFGPNVTDGRPALAAFGAALIAAAFVKLLVGAPRMRRQAWLLALYLFVPLAIAWAASLNRPIFSERYSIAALAPFQLLLAIAVVHRAQFRSPALVGQIAIGRLASAALGIALVAVTLAGLRSYQRSGVVDGHPRVWHGFIRVVNRYAGALPAERIRIALNFPDPVFTYYHQRYLPDGPAFITLPYRAGDAEGAQQVAEELKMVGVERVLLQIVDSFWDGQGIAASALAREFVQVEETYSGRWTVKIYGRLDPAALRPFGVAFAGGPSLEAAHARVDMRGRLVEVYLRWNGARAPLNGAEKLFIHISRSDDPAALVGQRDEPLAPDAPHLTLADGRSVHAYGVRLNEDLPPGRYDVRIGIYDPSRDGMPRLRTGDGRDALVIASFEVR